MLDALLQAAKLKGVNVWREAAKGGEELNPQALADLFAMTQGHFSLDKSPRTQLAKSILAVLNHPNVPLLIYSRLSEGVNEVFNDINSAAQAKLTDSVPHLLMLLEHYPENARRSA